MARSQPPASPEQAFERVFNAPSKRGRPVKPIPQPLEHVRKQAVLLPGDTLKRSKDDLNGLDNPPLTDAQKVELVRRNTPLGRKQTLFLAYFAETGLPYASCERMGYRRDQWREWVKSTPGFAERFEIAQSIASEKLEVEAIRRAVHGIPRKKFFKGEPVIDPETEEQYVENEYSDTLLVALLKANNPKKFKEQVDINQKTTVSFKPITLDGDKEANMAETIPMSGDEDTDPGFIDVEASETGTSEENGLESPNDGRNVTGENSHRKGRRSIG